MDAGHCELALSNASDEEIDAIVAAARTVAMVGVSDTPDRASYQVARYLHEHGVRVIPVNPAISAVLGRRAFASLEAIPADVSIDIVDIFRRPEFISEIVDSAIARRVGTVWMQLRLVHNEAAERARQAGLAVVMDRCLMVEHRRWLDTHRG